MTKICKSCGVEKPLSEYYFQKMKLATGEVREYPKPYCKTCQCDISQSKYKDEKEKGNIMTTRAEKDLFKVGSFICY